MRELPSDAECPCRDRLALAERRASLPGFPRGRLRSWRNSAPPASGSPFKSTRAHFRVSPERPVGEFARGDRGARADIIVPCDDRIVGHLCALRELGDHNTSTLIDTSLGRDGANGVIAKRGTLREMGQLPEVDVPRTDSVASLSDLRIWVHEFGLPAILKLDGSWGGNDVVVVRRESEIRRTFWEMSLRRSVLRGVKRYVTNGDVEALAGGGRPSVSSPLYLGDRRQLR